MAGNINLAKKKFTALKRWERQATALSEIAIQSCKLATTRITGCSAARSKIRVETTYPICSDYAEYILQVGYLHTNGSGSQNGSGTNVNDWVLTRVYSSKAKGNYDHEIIVGTPTDTGFDGGGYDIYQVPIYLENDHYAQHRVTVEADRGTFSRVTSFAAATSTSLCPLA